MTAEALIGTLIGSLLGVLTTPAVDYLRRRFAAHIVK